MSKFDEKLAGYKANMEKLGIKYDEDKLIDIDSDLEAFPSHIQGKNSIIARLTGE